MPSSSGLPYALRIVGTAPIASTRAIKITAVSGEPENAHATSAIEAPATHSQSSRV